MFEKFELLEIIIVTFVDRLIRKSIANSDFALSLILESNTGGCPEDSQFFVQKSVREILSCETQKNENTGLLFRICVVTVHISIFEEIKCVSTKNTISVSAGLTQYRVVHFIFQEIYWVNSSGFAFRQAQIKEIC